MTLRPITTRLVAALTLAGAASLGAVSPPAQATAAAPTHVAIVVGNVGSACVPYHSGMTGADVLNSNFTVTWGAPPRYAGFVLKINGIGTSQPTTTKYWAYFHNSGGGWVYSGSGAASDHPQPGTVEGWAYNNGGVGPATAPSYATICAGRDPAPPPAPTPSHPVTPAPSTHRSTTAPAGQPGQPGAPTSATGDAGHRSASTPAAGSHATSAATRHSSPARTTPSSGGAASSDQSASDATQPIASPVSAKRQDKGSSAAPAVGTALALLAVAGLGGAAFWRLRRQKLG